MRTTQLLLCLGSLIFLSGCGGGSTSASSSTAVSASKTAVVGVQTPSSVSVVTAQ